MFSLTVRQYNKVKFSLQEKQFISRWQRHYMLWYNFLGLKDKEIIGNKKSKAMGDGLDTREATGRLH